MKEPLLMRNTTLKAAAALFTLTLSACAHWPPADASSSGSQADCDTSLSPADNTRLTGIEQQVQEGKYYAALAQLDELRLTGPKATLIRAHALRRTSKADGAEPLYASLLKSCYAGQAHHGLGLMQMRQGEQETGLAHLRAARDALPTSADVRNDLGYALLLQGRLDDAQFEFLTALDLAPNHPRAGRNAVTLLFKKGDEARARALGQELGLDQSTMDKLRTEAAESRQGAPAVSPPSP